MTDKMSSPTESLTATLKTSIVLCERFASSLAPDAPVDLPPTDQDAPSPLILLSAAATALRAQVTKLSLLAITAPFTPSAITTCLNPLNESILTSLVTAALLATPELFIASFSAECRSLTAAALRDMQALLQLLETRSQDGTPQAEVPDQAKKAFTEATGRVWDSCDKLVSLATGGVLGYVVQKSKQWLELIWDAVGELEEWDPLQSYDDYDGFPPDPSDDPSDDDNEDEDEDDNQDEDDDDDEDEDDDDDADNGGGDDIEIPYSHMSAHARAVISAGVREQALKVLNRIPQSIHVVIKQRLEKIDHAAPLTPTLMARLDRLLQNIRKISDLIDEGAAGMYYENPELGLKQAGEARAVTLEVVESVVQPFSNADSATTETAEDKYVNRALRWIQQVVPDKE